MGDKKRANATVAIPPHLPLSPEPSTYPPRSPLPSTPRSAAKWLKEGNWIDECEKKFLLNLAGSLAVDVAPNSPPDTETFWAEVIDRDNVKISLHPCTLTLVAIRTADMCSICALQAAVGKVWKCIAHEFLLCDNCLPSAAMADALESEKNEPAAK
jgi:hypothetical protein